MFQTKTFQMYSKAIAVYSAVLILSGCATGQERISIDAKKSIQSEKSVQQAKHKTKHDSIMEKHVKASFVNANIYYAIKEVAKSLNIDFDSSFVPYTDYKVTMKFDGTLHDFLSTIYRQSGVRYSYRDGILKVFNKKNVENRYSEKMCGLQKPTVSLSFDSVNPISFFKYMNKHYNMNFVFDMKFHDLGNQNAKEEFSDTQKEQLEPVSFYYRGCDKKAALYKFAEASDLKLDQRDQTTYLVKDYMFTEFDIPVYFDVDFKQSGGGIDNGKSSSTKSTVSNKENIKKDFLMMVKKYLSRNGKVHVSSRGYLEVFDKPSYVRNIKKIMRTEARRQAPIDLAISIIRVELKDNLSLGVDWTRALTKVADNLGYNAVSVGLKYADGVTGGVEFKARKGGLTNIVKALQEYGNAKIVKDYHSIGRSGIQQTFKAITEQPYVTTSVVNNGGVSEVAAEAKTASVGLTLTVIPTLAENGEIVNLSVSTILSRYEGDKTFNVQSGEFKLPVISSNELQMPASVRMGNTVILTGMKSKSGTIDKNGIPGLSQAPSGLGGLFGINSSNQSLSEYLIVITPKYGGVL